MENSDGPQYAKPQTQVDNSLHYGDFVYLLVENIGAYIQSSGFSNSNLYAQKDNFGTQIFCRNRRDFVFQIQPKMSFESRKDYKQTLRFFNENMVAKENAEEGAENPAAIAEKEADPQAQAEAKKRQEKQQQEIAVYKKKLSQLRKKMLDEEESNKRLVERRKGEHVTYGSEIQLFHLDSESYICTKKTSADLERTCNKVTLVDRPSAGIFFKIMPRYKYRQEGEKIKYGDQIVFLNVKIGLYLHVCDIQIPMEKPLSLPLVPGTTKNEITPVIIDRRCPPINYVPLYEVNAGTGFSRFRCVPFCTFEEDDKRFLRGGCVVTLRHSELQGLLSSDDNDFTDDGLAEVFLWVYKGKEEDVENFNTQSLFEIEIAQPENAGMIARTSDDTSYGHKYRLRHLNTGRLATVQEITFEGERVVTLGLAEHVNLKSSPSTTGKGGDAYNIADGQDKITQLEDNTLFMFVPTTVDDDSRIKNQSCVKIQHCKSQLYVSMMGTNIFKVKMPEDEPKEEDDQSEYSGKIYERMEDEELNNANRHVIQLKEQAGYEDAFFIEIIQPDTLKDILFVSTLVGILKKNIPFICNGQPIAKDRFVEMDLIMKMLEAFSKCEEKSSGDNDPLGSSENDMDMNALQDKITKRQKILRELYLVEYIVQILYFPFATKSFTLSEISQDDFITLLCQDAYQLLDAAVGGYEINERYASQWINFFFSQAMRTNKKNDISAQATVEELLSDNTKLLETRITPAIIKKFINLCKTQEKDKKLIMLLTALCTCYGKAVEHNQGFIVKFLLEDKETSAKLMMPIRNRQGQLEVKLQANSWITLSNLEDLSQGRDEGRIYKYFKSIVDLAANLNIGRNTHAYQQLVNIYAFDPVFQIIYDGNLPFDLRSCFLKLMNSMHLDREPLGALEIPTTTVVMYDIPPLEEFAPEKDLLSYKIKKSQVEIPLKLLKLKEFVLAFLQGENGVQDLNNKKKNRFVYNMMTTLNFMLMHGFYNDQEELNALTMPLIMLLDGSDDVFEEEGGDPEADQSAVRYKYTQKSEIMLMSKKLQCDCLIFISQLELDARAELFLSKIKKQVERDNPIAQIEQRSLLENLNPAGSGSSLADKIALRVSQKSMIPQLKQDQMMSLDQIRGQSSNVLSAIGGQAKKRSEIGENIKGLMEQSHAQFLDLIAQMKGFEAGTGEIYICILFDLLLYQYNELNQAAFELLIRYFNRKSSLLDSLQNIQILESQKSIEILNKVKSFKAQLSDLQSEAEVFMNSEEPTSLESKQRICEIFTFLTRYCTVQTVKNRIDSPGIKQRKSSGLDEGPVRLEDLIGKLKDEDYVRENLKPEDDSIVLENEEFTMFFESPKLENKENQRLMMNFSIYEFALYFIKFRTDDAISISEPHLAMLKQCYRFLIKFVRGNTQNQTKLRDSLEYFLKDIDKHSLAIQLVYEIFKDNKKFLNLNASKILKRIANCSEKTELKDSKKGSMYKLLTAFCRCKEKLVRANQQDIVVYLTVKGPLSNIFYLFVGEGVKDMIKLLQESKQIRIPEDDTENINASDLIKQSQALSNPGNPSIYMKREIINIIALIELLTLCCEGKSDKAEEKCQKELLTLENSTKIIKSCEYLWPMKRTMVNYVWQCFLDSNSKTIFIEPYLQNIDLIWELAELLMNDAKNIVESMPKQLDNEVMVKYPYKKQIPLRDESVQYLIESILPFFKYLLKRKDIYIEEDKEHIIAGLTEQAVNFYYQTKDMDAKKTTYNILGYIYTKHNLSKYLEGMKHPLIGLHPGNIEENPEGIDNMNEELKRQETFNYDASDSNKMNKMLQSILNNEEVKNLIEQEFEELVLWFTNIEQRVEETVSQNQNYNIESFRSLTFPNMINALIQMLDKRELSKPLHTIGLQIMRKMIEIENKNCFTPAAEWDTEDYIEFKGQIVSKQDSMVDNGAVDFLCMHIADLDDDDHLEQCVLFGISMLLGGNNKAQNAFLEFFRDKDPYNKTLSKLKAVIIKEFDKAKIYLLEKNAKLTMIAKTQERMALYLIQKQQKQQKAEEKAAKKKKASEDQIMVEVRPPQSEDMVPFAGLVAEEEEEEDVPDAFDNTLENLMTIEETGGGGDVSMVTDNAAQAAPEGAEGEKAQQGEKDNAQNNDSRKSLTRVVRILRFLQLMVEGHFTPLQDHLREQKMSDGEEINPKTFDFVGFIATMLGIYQKQFINCYSMDLGAQMLDTLIELIQGPSKENQRSLVSSKAIDNCKDILIQGQSERELKQKGLSGDKAGMIDELKQKAVKLLLSIIEGPIDAEIMRSIVKTLDDFVVIFERLKQVYNTFLTDALGFEDPDSPDPYQIENAISKDSFDDDAITEGFDLFALIKNLADCVPSVAEIVEGYKEEPYYQFFEKNTGFIEINHEVSKNLLRVYFPIKPVCKYLSKQTRSILMREVDRSSPQQKIMDLLKAVPDIVDEMDHIEVLAQATIKITPALTDKIRLVALLNATAICVLITAFYEYGIHVEEDGGMTVQPVIDDLVHYIMLGLGAFQILVAVLMIIGELITRGKLITQSKWREFVDEQKPIYQNLVNAKKEAPGYSEFNIIKAPDLSLLDARLILLTQGPDAQEFSVEDSDKKNFGHLILRIEYMWICLRFLLQDGQFFFMLTYFALSILGIMVSPTFYSMMLLDIINRFPSLANVIKAVTTNGNQLLMSAMLELILLWIYCVLLFTFFFDHYFNDDITLEDGSGGDSMCRSLFNCYMYTLTYGLRNGGGIGDSLPSNSWFNESKEIYIIRSINDLSFMIIIILLFFNIIFGIIIDTFAGLRDEAAEMEDDMKNVCYICGIDRESMDKDAPNGFMYHIEKEHSLWSYIFFIIYLNNKDTTDYTGIESYVNEKVQQDDIVWFPFNRAICLELDQHQVPEGKAAAAPQ